MYAQATLQHLLLAIHSAFITRSSNIVVLAANGGPSRNAVRIVHVQYASKNAHLNLLICVAHVV